MIKRLKAIQSVVAPLRVKKLFIIIIYRVFDNERNEALVYHFGQKDAYDVGHVAKVSDIYDILIFGF